MHIEISYLLRVSPKESLGPADNSSILKSKPSGNIIL